MGRPLTGLAHPPRSLMSGNLPGLRRDRLDFLESSARQYGEFVPLRFGSRQVLLVNQPQAIEEVLVTKNRCFRKHFALRLNPNLLGNGLLTSDGPHWLRQRRMAQPAFHPQRIHSYGETFVELTKAMVSDWREGEIRDIVQDFMGLTLRIATRTLFSSDIRGREQSVGEAMVIAQTQFLKRFNALFRTPLWVPTRSNRAFKKIVNELNTIVYRLIEERRRDPGDRGDLLSMLLQARDEDDQSSMTNRQLRDEVMTLFLAGHETTALMLSWAWRSVSDEPRVFQKLQAEVNLVLGERPATPEDLPQLKYLEQVLLETMRLYPSAYLIGREAIEKCEIGGYDIPVGMTVWTSQWVTHRDPRFWEKALEFQPERWESDPLSKQPRIIYYPFGAGPRVCIGNSFAMLEAGLILATLIQQIRIQRVADEEVTPTATFTLRPSGPIHFRVEKQRASVSNPQ